MRSFCDHNNGFYFKIYQLFTLVIIIKNYKLHFMHLLNLYFSQNIWINVLTSHLVNMSSALEKKSQIWKVFFKIVFWNFFYKAIPFDKFKILNITYKTVQIFRSVFQAINVILGFKSILEKILVVRTPESQGLNDVVEFIKNFLGELKAGFNFINIVLDNFFVRNCIVQLFSNYSLAL